MRADFRQYYGCSADQVMRESIVEAADLVRMLPPGSRVMGALGDGCEWTQEDYLLANIANSLQTIIWMFSEDGQKNRNRPEPIVPPSREESKPKPMAMPVDELAAFLARPRKEV